MIAIAGNTISQSNLISDRISSKAQARRLALAANAQNTELMMDSIKKLAKSSSDFHSSIVLNVRSHKRRWLKQHGISGKVWRVSTQYDNEDFILSACLEQQSISDFILSDGAEVQFL